MLEIFITNHLVQCILVYSESLIIGFLFFCVGLQIYTFRCFYNKRCKSKSLSFFNLRYTHNESQIRLRFMRNKIIVLIVSDAFNAKLYIGKHGINQSHFLILFAFFFMLFIHHAVITVITILFPV